MNTIYLSVARKSLLLTGTLHFLERMFSDFCLPMSILFSLFTPVFSSQIRQTYETTMSEWLAVEAIVRQRDKEVMAMNMLKLSSESQNGEIPLVGRERSLSNEVWHALLLPSTTHFRSTPFFIPMWMLPTASYVTVFYPAGIALLWLYIWCCSVLVPELFQHGAHIFFKMMHTTFEPWCTQLFQHDAQTFLIFSRCSWLSHHNFALIWIVDFVWLMFAFLRFSCFGHLFI